MTFGTKTLSIIKTRRSVQTTLGITTLSITIYSGHSVQTTFRTYTLGMTTLGTVVYVECRYNECRYAECWGPGSSVTRKFNKTLASFWKK